MYLYTDDQLNTMPYSELEAIERAAYALYSAAANDRDYLKWAYGSADTCEMFHDSYCHIRRIATDRSIAIKAQNRAIENLCKFFAAIAVTTGD